jgi:hypothetical protein
MFLHKKNILKNNFNYSLKQLELNMKIFESSQWWDRD